MNEFKRNTILVNGKKLSFLYQNNNAKTTVLCFPQGLRDADYFISKYSLPLELNILVIDPPGIGYSDSYGKESSLENIVIATEALIDALGFNRQDIILMGKSFSSTYALEMLMRNDGYKGVLFIAGPRHLELTQAKFLKRFFNAGSKNYYIRLFFNQLIKFLHNHTDIKQAYYDWKRIEVWLILYSIVLTRFQSVNDSLVPTRFIFNGKDELVSTNNIEYIISKFRNNKYYLLPSKSHWGKITEEEFEMINQYLLELAGIK